MASNGDSTHNDSEHQPVHIDSEHQPEIANVIASVDAEEENVHIDIANVGAEESNSDTEKDNIVELVEDTTLYTLSGHSAPVRKVAVNPFNPSQVATGCDRKQVCLWHLGNQSHQTLENHKDGISSLQFSSDGKVLASGSYDGKINLWDTATGSLIRQLRGHWGSVEFLQWHPNCQDLILAGSSDFRSYLWEPSTGTCIQKLESHTAFISAGSFAPNGASILTGDEMGCLRYWDSDNIPYVVKSPHRNVITCMDFTEDSSRAMVGGLDGRASVINMVTGKVDGVFDGHQMESPYGGKSILCGSVWWSPRSWAVTGGWGRVIMWDLTRLETLHNYKLPSISRRSDAWVNDCVWSPESHLVYTGSSDGKLRVFDYRLPEELVRVFSGSPDAISSVAVASGGSLVLAGSADHVARVFDLRKQSCVLSI